VTWEVRLTLTEEGEKTSADVYVETGTRTIRGSGTAQRNPADFDVPAIGDELAAGRALVDAGRHLIGTASFDIESCERRPVDLA
jgi:hypothetical protein